MTMVRFTTPECPGFRGVDSSVAAQLVNESSIPNRKSPEWESPESESFDRESKRQSSIVNT
jgi:hypothetical protein